MFAYHLCSVRLFLLQRYFLCSHSRHLFAVHLSTYLICLTAPCLSVNHDTVTEFELVEFEYLQRCESTAKSNKDSKFPHYTRWCVVDKVCQSKEIIKATFMLVRFNCYSAKMQSVFILSMHNQDISPFSADANAFCIF